MRMCDKCRREFPDAYNYCSTCGHSLRILAFPIVSESEHVKYDWYAGGME